VASNQNERLEGWKEISSFIHRDERTARRWEKDLGMPVHRDPGNSQSRVYALRAEIDTWVNSRDHRELDATFYPTASDALSMGEPPDEHPVEKAPAAIVAPDFLRNPQLSRQHARRRLRSGLWLASTACVMIIAWLAGARLVTSFTLGPLRVLRLQPLTDDGRWKESLRTDGTTLFFGELEGERRVLVSLPVTGGVVRQIQTPVSNPFLQDVSPDGQRLLVTSAQGADLEQPLWILPAAAGSGARVLNILCHSAAWSLDGARIAYAHRDAVYLTNSDGTNRRLLIRTGKFPVRLRWAPDGHRLRFLVMDTDSISESPREVQVDSNAARPAAVPLSLDLGWQCCSEWDWPSVGNYFLLVRNTPQTAHLELVQNTVWNWPLARPQASEIPVSLHEIEGVVAGREPHTAYLNASGSHHGEFLRFDVRSAEFVPHLSGVSAEYLSYSRDGKWISYSRLPDHSLWRSRADESDAIQLTSAPYEVQFSSWSPDGSKIAFMARMPGKPWRIYLVPMTGGNPQEAATGDDQQGAPTWSRDGESISYGRVLCYETGPCDIRVIHLRDRSVETLPESAGLRTARWSPDGKYIAALHTDSHEVRLFHVQKRRWITIANSVEGDDMAWSRDSRYVYVNNPQEEAGVILRIRVSDRKREKVVDFSPLRRLHGSLNRWFTLAPDDSPILLRHIDAYEIYALSWTDQ